MSEDTFTKILDDHRELSSLPQTLAEVLKVIKDDDSSAQDLAEVIMRDPALTAKVLRIVNSPFYGVGREISTLSQAVMTLGQRAISALALSSSVYDLTGKWESKIDRKRFWRHSLEVAIASRMVAELVGFGRTEEAFIGGLLHDIGLLVLEKSFPQKFERIWKEYQNGEETLPLEEAAWGTNHARVGQFLMEQWHLPAAICQAIGMHHSEFDDSKPDSRNPMNHAMTLCRIVALGNSLATFSIGGTGGVIDASPERRTKLIRGLDVDSDKLEEIHRHLIAETAEQARFLEIDIGSEQDLLAEANQALYIQYRAIEELLKEQQRLQREMQEVRLREASLEALKTISATFNHYVNNAAATILGRAQLIQVDLDRGLDSGQPERIKVAADIIIRSVNTITLVMNELKKLSTFDTVVYHDDTFILNIEDQIKKQLEEIQADLSASAV